MRLDLHRRFNVEIHPIDVTGTFAPTLNVDLTDLALRRMRSSRPKCAVTSRSTWTTHPQTTA